MKKFAGVAGMLLLSSSLLAGCASTAAPNRPDHAAGNNQGVQTQSIGGMQFLPSNAQGNTLLQTKVRAVPGTQNANVYVAGNAAYVVFNEEGTSGVTGQTTGRTTDVGRGITMGVTGTGTPGVGTRDPGMIGTGSTGIGRVGIGTNGRGTHAVTPIQGAKGTGSIGPGTTAREQGVGAAGSHIAGTSPDTGGKLGTKYGVTSLALHRKIADTIQQTNRSIQHVYFVTKVR